jgi:hypothetical protein
LFGKRFFGERGFFREIDLAELSRKKRLRCDGGGNLRKRGYPKC